MERYLQKLIYVPAHDHVEHLERHYLSMPQNHLFTGKVCVAQWADNFQLLIVFEFKLIDRIRYNLASVVQLELSLLLCEAWCFWKPVVDSECRILVVGTG